MSFASDDSFMAATVRQFMQLGHPENIAAGLTIPKPKVRDLCAALFNEESTELSFAIDHEDIVEIADGIADSIWVLLYTAHCYGIPFDAIWNEVARTNMAKFPNGVVTLDPVTGKILKPPGWQPPDIAGVLAEHIPRCELFCPNANCQKMHLDEGDFATRPHMTHRCVDDSAGRGCGREWVVLPYAFGAQL